MELLSHIGGSGALDVLLDALKDSALILPVLFLTHVLMAVIDRYAGKKTRNGLKGSLSPLIGTVAGILPQCGFSVAATRLYTQRYIPLGALISVYISTSDEALLILLSSPESAKKILPLLLIKIVYALIAGYTLNFIAYLAAENKKRKRQSQGGSILITCTAADDINLFSYDKDTHEVPPLSLNKDLSVPPGASAAPYFTRPKFTGGKTGGTAPEIDKTLGKTTDKSEKTKNKFHDKDCGCHKNCCGATHCSDKASDKRHVFVIHPLIHTLKIFAYVLAVNLVLGFIIFLVTPERFEGFISGLSIWQPALSALIGLIPNCAAGVVLAEMYSQGLLTLGSAVAGFSAAAGLGYAILIKEHKNKLTVLLIILGMFVSGTLVGMLTDLII